MPRLLTSARACPTCREDGSSPDLAASQETGLWDCGPPFSRLNDNNNSRLAICDSNVNSQLEEKAVSVKRSTWLRLATTKT
jgi:hypothetical protein